VSETKRKMTQIAGIASVLLTPLYIFISGPLSLYQRNQDSMGYHREVLNPFVPVALAVLGVGLLLYALSSIKVFRYFLWVYYLSAALVYVHSFTRSINEGISNSYFLLIPLLILFVVGSIVLSIRVCPRKIAPALAALAIFIGVFEIVRFSQLAEPLDTTKDLFEVLGYTSPDAGTISGDSASENAEAPSDLPNIYHFLFDQFQTEAFEHVISAEVREKELDGFFFFPKTTTAYAHTHLSIPSIFQGRHAEYSMPGLKTFYDGTFQGEQSLLYSLKEAGYETFGFQTFFKKWPEKLFDYSTYQGAHGNQTEINIDGIFRNLWIYSYFPTGIARRLMGDAAFDRFEFGKVLPNSLAAESYAAFTSYLAAEEALPTRGRYTYSHVLVPHTPSVLNSDCTMSDPETDTRDGGNKMTDHFTCGGKMLLDFIKRLRELDRFDDSLIIIQSDHGSCLEIREGLLNMLPMPSVECDRYIAHSLLLVKPPESYMKLPAFTRLEIDSTLLDVTPTILNVVGVGAEQDFDGIPLLPPDNLPKIRPRYFHQYKRVDKWGRTNEMTRWIFQGDEMILDKVIPITD